MRHNPIIRKAGHGHGYLVLSLLSFLAALRLCAQDYSVDWYTIDGGGGTSAGASYTLTGTIGQPDAGTMSGGNYTLTGGFWGVFAAVQTPGAPTIVLALTNANTVLISWPLPEDGWRLQYTPSLSATPVWTEILPPYQTTPTGIQYAEPAPPGNRFYRLHKP